MSNYQKERGELLLPAAAVNQVRNALTNAENDERRISFDLAKRVYAHLKSPAGKQSMAKIRKAEQEKEWSGLDVRGVLCEMGLDGERLPYSRIRNVEDLLVERIVVPSAWRGGWPAVVRKFRSPQKKNLPPLPLTKTYSWSCDEGTVDIDPKTRVLTWRVEENNHSVDHAWASQLGKVLSAALEKVNWTRDTGGVFRYTDEYARDNELDGGFSSVSISRSYGPRGKAAVGWATDEKIASFRAERNRIKPKKNRIKPKK